MITINTTKKEQNLETAKALQDLETSTRIIKTAYEYKNEKILIDFVEYSIELRYVSCKRTPGLLTFDYDGSVFDYAGLEISAKSEFEEIKIFIPKSAMGLLFKAWIKKPMLPNIQW